MVPVSRRLGLFQGDGHGRPAAHAHEKPFGSGQTPGHFEGRFVLDIDLFIQQVFIKNFRPIGLLHILEPLDFMAEIGLHTDKFEWTGCIP